MADRTQCTMAAAMAIMQGTVAILALEEVAALTDDDETAESLLKVAEALAAQNHAMSTRVARLDELARRRWWRGWAGGVSSVFRVCANLCKHR